jgi:hypothetical protein
MEYQIGPHRVVVEDDVVLSYANHAVTAVEMRRILDICASVFAKCGRLYVVTLMGPDFDMPPDARKLASAWGRQHQMYSIIVGASLAMRTLVNLIARAHKLLGGKDQVVFADSEAAARSVIAKHKANLPPVP